MSAARPSRARPRRSAWLRPRARSSGDDGPMELRSAIEAFARHLAVDRGFSAHTVRAYRGDLSDLADFVEQRALAAAEVAADEGADSPDAVDVRELDLETL